ncbi:MAG TPA: PIN domain-containing protein [Vicinamibacteria bacterium]|nr:PIN domain-containing protein [Vicinamibacteria bacterium]
MILVDTSVLIDYFAGRATSAVSYLDRLLEAADPFYVTPSVVQELLQGAADEREWRKLRSYLTSLMFVDVRDPMESHLAAARIYFDCRRRGLTVRSSADCLIAQVALERKLALLHSDRDFDAIAKVRPLHTLP